MIPRDAMWRTSAHLPWRTVLSWRTVLHLAATRQVSLTFECLNDGTCASGMGAARGKFYDKDTCDANCGAGKWQCMQHVNQQVSGVAFDRPMPPDTAAS